MFGGKIKGAKNCGYATEWKHAQCYTRQDDYSMSSGHSCAFFASVHGKQSLWGLKGKEETTTNFLEWTILERGMNSLRFSRVLNATHRLKHEHSPTSQDFKNENGNLQ